MVREAHLAGGARLAVVRKTDVVGAGVHVQTDGSLIERIRDAVDGVVSLLQIDTADGSPVDSALGDQPNPLAGSRSVEGRVVAPEQRQ